MTFLLLAVFSSLSSTLNAQEWEREGATFGIQLKPIIPNDIFRIRGESTQVEDVTFQLDPLVGYKAGAVIRFGIHNRFTLESGINYIRRPYQIRVTDGNNVSELKMRVIAYDIPLIATYYVRLTPNLYLNSSAGMHIHFLPSNLFVGEGDVSILSVRRNWLTPSMSARVGFEYRTRNSGYFFLGPNYRFFFQTLYLTEIEYRRDSGNLTERFFLDGEYFGLVFRYVFSPNPE